MKKYVINFLFLLIPLTLPFLFYLSNLFYDYEYRSYFFVYFLFYIIYLLFILVFRKQADVRVLLIGTLEYFLIILAMKMYYIIFFWFTAKLDFNLISVLTLWILYGYAFAEVKIANSRQKWCWQSFCLVSSCRKDNRLEEKNHPYIDCPFQFERHHLYAATAYFDSP